MRARDKLVALVSALGLVPACEVKLSATGWGGDAALPPASDSASDTISGAVNPGLRVLTDTNRNGLIDDQDVPGGFDWSWRGLGAFLIANVDDDDRDGLVDASDGVVNGPSDEQDLAPIVIVLSSELLAKTTSIRARATTGAERIHLFEKTSLGWRPANDALLEVAARIELGVEAVSFADADWDGFVTVTVEILGPRQSIMASQAVKLRVAPWLLLANAARLQLLYLSASGPRLRADINRVLASAGLPEARTASPPGQDLWAQDTMEIGYTQLPGRPALPVVMNGQRPNASDLWAVTLLGPDFGFISVGAPRPPAASEDAWMDWLGNLEVSPPVPGFPLGRIYYGRSDRTTFHPAMVKFLEAQEVQVPCPVYVNWLTLQLVDELMTFVPDAGGRAKLLIVSPAVAGAVLGSGYDAANQQIQATIDETVALLKTAFGLAEDDIIRLPVLFSGSGTDYGPLWSNPVNAVYVDGMLLIGTTNTPAPVKADIEKRLAAIGVVVAWVDDSEYAAWAGNVHSATNTLRIPFYASFTDALR